MLCFLTNVEGCLLGLLLIATWAVLRLWGRNDKLRDQAKGLRPQDMHPQDRLRRSANPATRTRVQTLTGSFGDQPVVVSPEEQELQNWLHNIPQPQKPATDPLDWLQQPKAEPVQTTVTPEPTPEPEPEPVKTISKADESSLFSRSLPHIKLAMFALSIVAVWFGFAAWYDNLSHYTPPSGDELGDFRILYLKKTIGAILPLISAVGAALGLLFMINPRYYIYLNGWFPTDYDFYTDLRHLERPESYRRVLVFVSLFGLLLLVSLWVLLHSSPQELTL